VLYLDLHYGKLSLDKTLPKETIEAIKEWASNRRKKAFTVNNYQELKDAKLSIGDFTGANLIPTAANLAIIRG
jgi:hypothetical protein